MNKEIGHQPVAIVGPKASGKSSLSLALAHELDGEIVNVDSMQLYRGMDIGTAKLPLAERQGIPHHLLDIWEVTKTASVAEYQQRAVETVEEISNRGKLPILVGGSMLYMQSLVDAWQFPPTDPEVRGRYESLLKEIGIDRLHAQLAAVDPVAASIIEDRDPRRTVRALEVIELTGKPFQASQPPKNAPTRWGTRMIGLETTPEWLNPRIAQRTDAMFEQGLIDEIHRLVSQGLAKDSTAGRAIGYAQGLGVIDGHLTIDEACEDTKLRTRRYVRRQKSWFRRDKRITWIDAANYDVAELVAQLG